MRILIVNVPHTAIGSRVPDDHLPPLGLLSIGGPLIEDGHDVELLDCEFGPLALNTILKRIEDHGPELLLLGHSGSTTAHPISCAIAAGAKEAHSGLIAIYGGVFPTYHWRDILKDHPEFDYIVRGEGEETCRQLVSALSRRDEPRDVNGIAFRRDGMLVATPPQKIISDLDAYRIGWELIDFKAYSYWGRKRAVVVQFSRGCPHPCNYCGQRGFWTKWRHRNPEKFAEEIARLHREQGVEVFNLADENPTSSRAIWKRFLMALIAENIDVTIIGTTRADDIVRDRDILHLYRQAGIERFLLGTENTDEAVLTMIKKGGSTTKDREAIRLMREHGMIALVSWVSGFEDEKDADYWRVLRQLFSYDPDQIQSLYVTPHRWTPFYGFVSGRKVIQLDQRKWDYKHQVLASKHMPVWRSFLWVKFIEVAVQMRPRVLWRRLTQKDPKIRHAQRWYYKMGRRVWFHEVFSFFFRDRHERNGPTVEEFWGPTLEHEEEALARPVARSRGAMKTLPVHSQARDRNGHSADIGLA